MPTAGRPLGLIVSTLRPKRCKVLQTKPRQASDALVAQPDGALDRHEAAARIIKPGSVGGPMFGMRRREFITLLGGAAAWPLTARAQQPDRMRRIGVLMPAASDNQRYQASLAAFLQGLQQLGWTDGRNVMPLGQSQDIPRAGPGGRVSPRF